MAQHDFGTAQSQPMVQYVGATRRPTSQHLENLEEGELLNGRMSRDLAPQTDRKEGEAQDYAAGESPHSEDGMIPSFEFFKVPPPSLPAKSV